MPDYIYGVGHHTEDDCRPEDAFMQVYRPLYEEAYACSRRIATHSRIPAITNHKMRVPVESDHGFRWKLITQSGGR
jgi:hypothetical protein